MPQLSKRDAEVQLRLNVRRELTDGGARSFAQSFEWGGSCGGTYGGRISCR